MSDVPGDWVSVRAVWTGTPEPLSVLVGQVRQARGSDNPAAIAMASWSLLVTVPRALLHLASWMLQHPLRTAVAVLLLAVWLLTR